MEQQTDVNAQRFEEFKQKFSQGRLFTIIGIITSFFLVGIPILIFGIYRLYEATQIKMELKQAGYLR